MQIRPQIWLVAALGLLLALGVASWGTKRGGDADAAGPEFASRGALHQETLPTDDAGGRRTAAGDRRERHAAKPAPTYRNAGSEERGEAVRLAMREAQQRGAERAEEAEHWLDRFNPFGTRGGVAAGRGETAAAPGDADAAAQEAAEQQYADEIETGRRYERSAEGHPEWGTTPGTDEFGRFHGLDAE